MDQLTKYVVALTNLYGIVDKDKIVEIYNSQNEEQISTEDVEKFTIKPLKDVIAFEYVCVHKGYFVHEMILYFDEFDMLLREKAGKPYYVPNKEKLLKYTDEFYFEKNEQFETLVHYMKDEFFDGDLKEAEEYCAEIQLICQDGFDPKTIISDFERMDIVFENPEQANEVMLLVRDLANNTRICENNGYTPMELFEKSEKPNLRPLPDEPYLYELPDDTASMVKKTAKKSHPLNSLNHFNFFNHFNNIE